MLNTAILLRATSGSGKSLLANTLQQLVGDKNCVIVSADYYMVDESGNYAFSPNKLGYAHHSCQLKFESALNAKIPLVIVSNVNAKPADFNFYLEKAREYGYIVHSLVVENRANTKDVHGLNEETLKRQEENILKSLKLR